MRGEGIDWALGGKVLIIAELKELLVERRVVGEDADGIVVDIETTGDRFDNNTIFAIVNNPVELGNRKLIIKGEVAEVELSEESASFSDGGALAE